MFLGGCVPLSCGEAPIVSQFGAYPREPAYLQTVMGGRFPVYRVKYWRFEDGGLPALQLEYEPPVNVADTASLRTYAREIWPAFRPYLDVAGTRAAIITATNLRRTRYGIAWTAQFHHFGLLADADSLGRWFLRGDVDPLPAADSGRTGIFQPDGSRFPTEVVARAAQEAK